MTKTKHTPGPWKVSTSLSGNTCITTVDHDTVVAWVASSGFRLADPATVNENAKLLAAAPELLARLQKLVVLDDDQLFGAINSEMKAYLLDCWKYLMQNGFIEY